MRALVLIVSCVIVLAILQASYLVVDAHTSIIASIVSTSGQASADTRDHKIIQPTAYSTTWATPPSIQPTTNQFCRMYPTHAICQHLREHNMAPETRETIQKVLDLSLDDISPPRARTHDHRSSSKSSISNAFSDEGRRRASMSGERNVTGVPEVLPHGYRGIFYRTIHLHHQSCSTHSQCGTGCCVERKNGRKVCHPGGTRGPGKKCTSSCVCQKGLRCWVNEKRRKKNKKVWGRCQDPKSRPGHFIHLTFPALRHKDEPDVVRIDEDLIKY